MLGMMGKRVIVVVGLLLFGLFFVRIIDVLVGIWIVMVVVGDLFCGFVKVVMVVLFFIKLLLKLVIVVVVWFWVLVRIIEIWVVVMMIGIGKS